MYVGRAWVPAVSEFCRMWGCEDEAFEAMRIYTGFGRVTGKNDSSLKEGAPVLVSGNPLHP